MKFIKDGRDYIYRCNNGYYNYLFKISPDDNVNILSLSNLEKFTLNIFRIVYPMWNPATDVKHIYTFTGSLTECVNDSEKQLEKIMNYDKKKYILNFEPSSNSDEFIAKKDIGGLKFKYFVSKWSTTSECYHVNGYLNSDCIYCSKVFSNYEDAVDGATNHFINHLLMLYKSIKSTINEEYKDATSKFVETFNGGNENG